MLDYIKGNLLESRSDALVNTVNEVGVMGKGIALMFKERFPESSKAYSDACKDGLVKVGKVYATPSQQLFPKWIIHFPTKKHWRNPSKIEWIRDGLVDLARTVSQLGIRSIAIPPLGCGNGGLDWDAVKPLIEEAFTMLPRVDVFVYEPTSRYFNKPKQQRPRGLTTARALITVMIGDYLSSGLDCTMLEVQKLSYFLDDCIRHLGLEDPLSLEFVANRYGPYADKLRHLLNTLDGSYLHSAKRINDASPYDYIWVNSPELEEARNYLKANHTPYLAAADLATNSISGFESPLGLELLSTVHWLVYKAKLSPTLSSVKAGISRWPGGVDSASRKSKIFDDRLVEMALDKLKEGVSA